MFPDWTEVCSVPRFAVDQEPGAAATTGPGGVGLHDEDDEDVLVSARSLT